jgi:hypothetical protein
MYVIKIAQLCWRLGKKFTVVFARAAHELACDDGCGPFPKHVSTPIHSMILFFNKIYLQYVNTLTAVLDDTKIVSGQPISCRTLAVRGGHGTNSSGYGRYSSEKMHDTLKCSTLRSCSEDHIFIIVNETINLGSAIFPSE